MKLKELKEKIDRLVARHGEDEVVIPILGQSGSKSNVTSVGSGVDWYDGCFLINSEIPLAHGKYQRRSTILSDLYLRKVSNWKDVLMGSKVAKYKTKKQEFDKNYEAHIWLYEQLEKEINEL